MKIPGLLLLAAGVVCAQAPSPVQKGVSPNSNGPEPIFRVDVTSKTIRAVNYNHRQGTTKIDFRGTALMPEARGTAEVSANTGASRISLKFDHLSNPAQFGPEYLTLVLWAITPEGRAERLGEVTLKGPNDKSAELYATTDLQSFGMIVTAEPYFSVSQPSDVVVMENVIRQDTTGTLEQVDAKYELLKRGDYTMNVPVNRLSPMTSDIKVPLQLREAREAIAIAKAQGADQYAADTMQKAAVDMQNAEGYYHSKNWKPLDTVAREATQMAEDARRISIQKEQDLAAQAAKDAAAQREADARRKAADEAQRRAVAEADTARAQSEAANAEQQKQEAQMAMLRARDAEKEANAAREAALAEEQKLAQEKASAISAREQAEKDAQSLRERLKDQLNVILATRDTARGLIVNMSDVLFDFNQATLKPGAKEKLAKVSGILLAYPTLHVSVEGHTDAIGSDEYNMKLSQRRADAVRDYLTSNGINQSNVQSVGMGKANPVASNDTAAGRSQNRRVEMVVTGDVIGQPISNGPATDMQPAPYRNPGQQ
jgi:outer membrane protein OmpA-like peptidoglycan-associated protein